eukprot:SAG31_NODE_424_length_15826_cov_4.954664_24_plen_201_part_00
MQAMRVIAAPWGSAQLSPHPYTSRLTLGCPGLRLPFGVNPTNICEEPQKNDVTEIYDLRRVFLHGDGYTATPIRFGMFDVDDNTDTAGTASIDGTVGTLLSIDIAPHTEPIGDGTRSTSMHGTCTLQQAYEKPLDVYSRTGTNIGHDAHDPPRHDIGSRAPRRSGIQAFLFSQRENNKHVCVLIKLRGPPTCTRIYDSVV